MSPDEEATFVIRMTNKTAGDPALEAEADVDRAGGS